MLLTVTKRCLRWKPRRFSDEVVIRVTPDNKREGQGCAFPFFFFSLTPDFPGQTSDITQARIVIDYPGLANGDVSFYNYILYSGWQ